MRRRQLLFIRDALIYTFTAFGGPQGHIAILLREFVEKRRYITEQELMELNALAQILPGPSSTQTLVGIAWKVGGLRLAIITFLIWIFPSAWKLPWCMADCSVSQEWKFTVQHGQKSTCKTGYTL